MISFVFIEDYHSKFTGIHVVIFKLICCHFTFSFQNTNYILYCFTKTWKSIVIWWWWWWWWWIVVVWLTGERLLALFPTETIQDLQLILVGLLILFFQKYFWCCLHWHINFYFLGMTKCSISYFCQIHKQVTWQLLDLGGYNQRPLKDP